jgi:hypothetical protein
MWPFTKRKFRMQGGRAGLFKYDDGRRRCELDWEMLVGGDFDLVVYGEQCRWTAPESRRMTKAEVTAMVQELVSETNLRVDLAFSDAAQDMRPKGAV